jgi:hypothetical protein
MQTPKSHYTRLNYSILQDIALSADDNSITLKLVALPPPEVHPEYQLYTFINAIYEATSVDDIIRILHEPYAAYFTVAFPLTDEWSCHITKGSTSLLSAIFIACSYPSSQAIDIDPMIFFFFQSNLN